MTDLLLEGAVSVLCFGTEIDAEEAISCLQGWADLGCLEGCRVVVLGGGELELFSELVAADRLFFLSRAQPELDAVVALLLQAASSRPRPLPEIDALTRDALFLTRTLAGATDLKQATLEVAVAIEEIARASRAHCWIFNQADHTLWTARDHNGPLRRESAAAGIVSFVAQTGSCVRVSQLADDRRYEPRIDNDGAPSDERLLAVPLMHCAEKLDCLAVLVALRCSSEPEFSALDQRRLERLVELLGPLFEQLCLQERLDDEAFASTQHGEPELFREQALVQHQTGRERVGHLLDLPTGWMRWTQRLLLLAFVSFGLFALVGSVGQYSLGIAVVQTDRLREVTAVQAGTVAEVYVEPGQWVNSGEILAVLHAQRQRSELDLLRREYQLHLVQRLREPTDPAPQSALVRLRQQIRSAEATLGQSTIRAETKGEVRDIGVRRGQTVAAGQTILTLSSLPTGGWGGGVNRDHGNLAVAPAPAVVAFFPGRDRSSIEVGMPMWIDFDTQGDWRERWVVRSVRDAVAGPAEARRLLGGSIADAVPISGPVTIVWARPPAESAGRKGESARYYEGAVASAEIRLRQESILSTLIPGLRRPAGRRR